MYSNEQIGQWKEKEKYALKKNWMIQGYIGFQEAKNVTHDFALSTFIKIHNNIFNNGHSPTNPK